jgi:hypothetical protein
MDLLASVTEVEQQEEQYDHDEEMSDNNSEKVEPVRESLQDIVKASSSAPTNIDLPIQSNPFETKAIQSNTSSVSNETSPDSLTKRKHEDADVAPSKRQELSKPTPATLPEPLPAAEEDGDDSDSDVSVHLNMELDDDDEEEEGE